MKAHELMTEPAITCTTYDTLTTAAMRMWDHDCGALPVVREDGKLAGMITDRDICMAAYTQGLPLDQILVSTVMSRHATAIGAEHTVTEIEQIMAQKQLRRLPVIDAEHRPIGMVTLNDLARESVRPHTRLAHGLPKLAHTLAAICRPRVRDRDAA
jgi:CBS domain-containing protein